MKQGDCRVTIRIQPGKEEVYQKFKTNVTETYHSDICYVITSLMEAFNQATQEKPNTDQPITMKFFKQNIQLNIGCNFNYNVKKARRIQTDTDLTVNKNIAWPNFIEEFPNMTEANKKFWLNELANHGIIPPPTQKNFQQNKPCDKTKLSFSNKVRNLKTFVDRILLRVLGSNSKTQPS